MNRLDEQYRGLLAEILYNGTSKEDRTGTGTISRFGHQIRHDMSKGFPLLTTKKVAFKTMVTELKWFLKGDTNIRYLVDNGCNIWNGDAYSAYLSDRGSYMTQSEFITTIKTDDNFAVRWGDLGPIYGKQWRDFNRVDQIKDLIEQLKANPDSRRHLVSAWNPSDQPEMALPPCHYSFQCYVADDKLSLMWNQRSVDTFLGLPFNIASYGLLLLLLCEETGLQAGTLIGSLGDVHLYNNHIDQAKEQIKRAGYDLSTIKLTNVDVLNGEFDVELIDYKHDAAIKAPLSN